VAKWGTSEGKQRYRCNSCGHTFCDDGAFPGMRTSAKAISAALEMYFDGLSLAKVARALRKAFGVFVSRITIWNWIQKYVPKVKGLVNRLVVDACHSWHVDETVVKVKGEMFWFWDGIDYDTRFVVNGMLTESRGKKEAMRFFKGARSQVGGVAPILVVTDGCGAYKKGISKNFWDKIRMGACKVIRRPGLKARDGKLSNNVIERFHNTIKERYKVLRGYGSYGGAANMLDGFVIQYNFLRPHMSLDYKTPAEAAGLVLPSRNGWGDLIQWASE
jgi:putative transposase